MSKMIAHNPVSFLYDADHKCAHYTIDRVHYMNAGELKEIIAKAVHKLLAKKDGNTAFDEGSDIPEYNASVKSSKATLTNKELRGATLEEKLDDYFSRVVSTQWWWVELNDDVVTIYKLNAYKFRKFAEKFAKITKENRIRFSRTNSKMLRWLDANA